MVVNKMGGGGGGGGGFLLVKVFSLYKHPHDMLDRPSYIVSSHRKLWICI